MPEPTTAISRRSFVKTTAAAWAGVSIITNPRRVFGANDRVRVAVVGVRGQGWNHVENYAKMPDVEIAALCDVDDSVMQKRLKDLEKMKVAKPATFVDFRKLIEDKSIDAVSVATPNHWHSLMGIWACQAGKDAYVEKPLSHRWFESKQLLEAAKKYNRVVQHGTNSRGSAAVQEAVQKMREGLLGEVYMARGLCYKRRKSIGKEPEAPVPAGVDYDLWTGPAPMKPYTKNRFHYNWHWIWDTGDGDFGNQGIHELDVARWGLGVTYPTKVSATGAKVMFDDDQETPNLLNVSYEFVLPDGKKRILVFEVRHWITHSESGIGTRLFGEDEIPVAIGATQAPAPEAAKAEGKKDDKKSKRQGATNVIGNLFYGEKGYLAVNGYTAYKTFMGDALEAGPEASKGGNTWANFIECVKSRKTENLNAPVEEGHISCTLLHLGNVSYRLGRSLAFDPVKQTVTGDDEANRMLRGEYRAPFTVPEKV